jgi:hypothetical protein
LSKIFALSKDFTPSGRIKLSFLFVRFRVGGPVAMHISNSLVFKEEDRMTTRQGCRSAVRFPDRPFLKGAKAMRASQARWALVTLSMLGVTGCQSGRPSWWPGRSKMPPYSSSSTTPPPGAMQNQLPSAQATPYGAEGYQDPNQYAQQTSGVSGAPADAYGANGYGAGGYGAQPGQDAYGNQTAGGAMPQNGPYNVEGYQQPAGGANGYAAGGGYGGASGGNYAAGQVDNPYVPAAAGSAYSNYQAQQPQGGYAAPQQDGYAAQQTAGGGYADPGYQSGAAAGGAPAYTADSRSGQGQGGYDTAPQSGGAGAQYGGNANYGAGGATPEQSPYSQPSDAAWSQGASAPGDTGYQPGATGYNPPGAQPYQSPAGNYQSDPNASQADPHYRPGGTSDYTPGATGAGAATSYAGGAAGGYDNSGYGDPAATASRYPSAATSTSRYPSAPTEDRYGRPTTANASPAGGAGGGYYQQR